MQRVCIPFHFKGTFKQKFAEAVRKDVETCEGGGECEMETIQWRRGVRAMKDDESGPKHRHAYTVTHTHTE